MAVAGQEIGVCAAHRTQQELVAHRSAIHEQKLHLRGGAVVGGKSRVSGNSHVLARAFDGYGVVGELASHDP